LAACHTKVTISTQWACGVCYMIPGFPALTWRFSSLMGFAALYPSLVFTRRTSDLPSPTPEYSPVS
jgi:hypothetical protein